MAPRFVHGLEMLANRISRIINERAEELRGKKDEDPPEKPTAHTLSAMEGKILPIVYGFSEVGGIVTAAYYNELTNLSAWHNDLQGSYQPYPLNGSEWKGLFHILLCHGALNHAGEDTFLHVLINGIAWASIDSSYAWNFRFWDLDTKGSGGTPVYYSFERGDGSESGSTWDLYSGTATPIKRPRIANIALTLPLPGDNSFPVITMYAHRDLSHVPFTYATPAGITGKGHYGANPAAVIYDLLTNDFTLGIDSALIDATSFSAAATAFNAKYGGVGLGLCFTIDEPTPAIEIISRIEEICGCVLSIDQNGLYSLRVLDASDASEYTMTDEDFIDVEIMRQGWEATYNSYKAKWINRFPPIIPSSGSTKFSEHEEVYKNEANIRVTGSERIKNLDMTWIHSFTSVCWRLDEVLKKESVPRLIINVTVDRRFVMAERGSVIHVTSLEYDIDDDFRVISKDTGKIDSNKVSFQMVQMVEKFTDTDHEDGAAPEGVDVEEDFTNFEVLTFPAFSGTSTTKTVPFSVDANSKVRWTVGQEQSGFLEFNVDYTVTTHNKIVLDPTIFADDIQANALGLLSVDVWEG